MASFDPRPANTENLIGGRSSSQPIQKQVEHHLRRPGWPRLKRCPCCGGKATFLNEGHYSIEVACVGKGVYLANGIGWLGACGLRLRAVDTRIGEKGLMRAAADSWNLRRKAL